MFWKNTLVYLLPGLSKYNIQTRFLTSKGIYIRVFGSSFAWKATYIRVFFLMLSRVTKKYKKYKKIHPRHSISNQKKYEDTCENTEDSVPTAAFEPAPAQSQLFEHEAARKQLEEDPPLAWQKGPQKTKSSPKL